MGVAKKEMRCWEVEHPDLGKVWVAAESWELATVEAAKVWVRRHPGCAICMPWQGYQSI